MTNQNVLRGAFLVVVGLFFGLGALRYPIGSLTRPGAGLFPLLISSLLLGLAVLMLIRSRVTLPEPLQFNWKNVFIIMISLVGFVVGTKLVDMAAGIVLLVFISSFAATSYSWTRSLVASAGLIAIALAFEKLLGLNLRVI